MFSGSAFVRSMASSIACPRPWKGKRRGDASVPAPRFDPLLGGRLLRLFDQALDLLAALVPDRLIEAGSILVLDCVAAFLADAAVETGTVPLLGALAALAPDLLVE